MDRFNIALITVTALAVIAGVGLVMLVTRDEPDPAPERDFTGYGELRLSASVCYFVVPGQDAEWKFRFPVQRLVFGQPTPLLPAPPVDPRSIPAAAGDAPVNVAPNPERLPASSFVTGDRQSVAASGQATGRAATLEIQREMNVARYGRSPLAYGINSAENTIEDDLKIVQNVFDRYRDEFGENPVGLNEDMVRRLSGHNPRQIAFLPPDHPSINAEGQWIDRWGTPFHFHQISGTHLEIISAGPDQQVWTGDDIVHNPADLEQLLESQTPTETNVSAVP